MHTFSRFARPYQRPCAAFSTVPVGNQIAESARLRSGVVPGAGMRRTPSSGQQRFLAALWAWRRRAVMRASVEETEATGAVPGPLTGHARPAVASSSCFGQRLRPSTTMRSPTTVNARSSERLRNK